jgi:hypothetical protein
LGTRLLLLVLAAGSLGLAQGTLSFEPALGSVGDAVTARAAGLTPGAQLQLVWADVNAGWVVAEGKFYGTQATETRTTVAEATVAADGTATFQFGVPEGFGYLHDVYLMAGQQQVARQGFTVVPALTLEPTSGPSGTPIKVTLTGVGYRFYGSVWHLNYDGAHSGWLSAITTNGTATGVIPAAGAVGPHTLQVMSGTNAVAYLNGQQAPVYVPGMPTAIGALFQVTPGQAVMPAPLAQQALPRRAGVSSPAAAGQPALSADFGSGVVGSPLTLAGTGFPPAATVHLAHTANRGNRLSGLGWEMVEVPLASATTDASGAFTVQVVTPDDLGGAHDITAQAGAASATLVYQITPSVTFGPDGVLEPGSEMTVHLKGVGWTETANIYTLLLDNGYLGYGCGFNTHGDVTIYMRAPAQSGWHFISLFPAIYRGELNGPGAPAPTANPSSTYTMIPMLNYQDHPGEELPAFHIAFEVR